MIQFFVRYLKFLSLRFKPCFSINHRALMALFFHPTKSRLALQAPQCRLHWSKCTNLHVNQHNFCNLSQFAKKKILLRIVARKLEETITQFCGFDAILLKFRYCEKATKVWPILHSFFEIDQQRQIVSALIFVVFSEYLNFIKSRSQEIYKHIDFSQKLVCSYIS